VPSEVLEATCEFNYFEIETSKGIHLKRFRYEIAISSDLKA
jgi:hypothetical protein